MRTAGVVLLSLWSGLNLLLAVGIVLAMLAFGRHAPALSLTLSSAEVRAADPRLLGTVDALAILGNACIAGFCALVLVIVWQALVKGARWAWPALAVSMIGVQACGFFSDARLGHHDLVANLASTAVLMVGLVLVRPGRWEAQK
jgi:hypothetical protein